LICCGPFPARAQSQLVLSTTIVDAALISSAWQLKEGSHVNLDDITSSWAGKVSGQIFKAGSWRIGAGSSTSEQRL